MATTIGIDPGASGGIACIDAEARAFKMPATERDIWETLAQWEPATCYIEKVGAMPGQGVSSMFSFGRSYGQLRMAAIAAGLRLVEVTPTKWQREFGLVFAKSKGLTGTQKKNRHKARAQELFPGLKVTHAIADALLIAEYGRRQEP